MPTFGSLFAGIGGIDLGLERAGWTCRWQVEWDAYCQRVLAKHWPDVPRYGDITTVDWSGLERVDLLAGGFPCQPVSVAGKRAGTADERWLWPEFARAIRDLRPRLVLVENVPGLLVGGGMDDVLGGLAELGYDTRWESVPAAAVGAPHLRYRVWIVAYRAELGWALADADDRGPFDAFRPGRDASRNGRAALAYPEGIGRELRTPTTERPGRPAGGGHAPDANGHEHQGNGPADRGTPAEDVADTLSQRGRGRDARREDAANAHAPGEGIGPGGNGSWWATEPDVGRVAHGVPSRVDRLRALGNAVVPQVVEVIGRQLLSALQVAA